MKQLLLQEDSGFNEMLFGRALFSASGRSKIDIAGNSAILPSSHKPSSTLQMESPISKFC